MQILLRLLTTFQFLSEIITDMLSMTSLSIFDFSSLWFSKSFRNVIHFCRHTFSKIIPFHLFTSNAFSDQRPHRLSAIFQCKGKSWRLTFSGTKQKMLSLIHFTFSVSFSFFVYVKVQCWRLQHEKFHRILSVALNNFDTKIDLSELLTKTNRSLCHLREPFPECHQANGFPFPFSCSNNATSYQKFRYLELA